MCLIAFSPPVGICGFGAAGAVGLLGMGMEKPRRGAARFLLGLVALRLSCACH